MSVLIHGMDMPTSCRACMFSRADIWNIDWCVLTEKDLPCDCPIVPVPPHGDLIDRDALVKSDRMVGKLMMYGGEYVYTQAEIDRAPTIIPADKPKEET